MTDPKGNSELCFPETLNVTEGNIAGLGKAKLTVSLGVSH